MDHLYISKNYRCIQLNNKFHWNGLAKSNMRLQGDGIYIQFTRTVSLFNEQEYIGFSCMLSAINRIQFVVMTSADLKVSQRAVWGLRTILKKKPTICWYTLYESIYTKYIKLKSLFPFLFSCLLVFLNLLLNFINLFHFWKFKD